MLTKAMIPLGWKRTENEGGGMMVRLTQSLEVWLWQNHREKLPLIMLGHVEEFTEEMQRDYIAWCQTDEGRQYLKGGSKYDASRDESGV